METTKIKMRVGEHEFEAEGPTDTVNSQFEAFRQLISELPRETKLIPVDSPANKRQAMDISPEAVHVPLENILHVAGRVVSLTALPASPLDAALLILLGHKDLRNHIAVTGQEIGDGLAQSGRPVPRVDRIMDKAIEDAFVLKTGLKRGTRYRLTNQGLNKALNIARELIATLP